MGIPMELLSQLMNQPLLLLRLSLLLDTPLLTDTHMEDLLPTLTVLLSQLMSQLLLLPRLSLPLLVVLLLHLLLSHTLDSHTLLDSHTPLDFLMPDLWPTQMVRLSPLSQLILLLPELSTLPPTQVPKNQLVC